MSLIKLFRKKTRKTLFTTPSHGQKFFIYHKFLQLYKYDISETDAHNPQKALLEVEELAKGIYGTKYTKFLTNGSTSGVIAAVLACTHQKDKVLLWDNAHPSHLNAVKLASATPVFYSVPTIEEWGIPDKTSPEMIEKYLKQYSDIKTVVVTSPTYEGVVSDISTIKQICEKYGAYLIVDEAHGALYPFSDELPQSAVNIADFCIHSLHKTAGGLNPTALLHSNSLDPTDALLMISTTSPSYPLLATVEANINFLNSARGKKHLTDLISNLKTVKNISNVDFFGDDITKINIKKSGLSGFELSEILFERYSIEDEKTNLKSTMLLCGIGTDRKKIEKLKSALLNL